MLPSPRLAPFALALVALASLGVGPCGPQVRFLSPQWNQLSLVGADLQVEASVPAGQRGRVWIELDGAVVLDTDDGSLTLHGSRATGMLSPVPEGVHQLIVRYEVEKAGHTVELSDGTQFEGIVLDRPDECEVLNDVECILPFPSSRYLEPADTATGVRVRYPPAILPPVPQPLDSEAYGGQDGFSPGVQILVHVPGGVSPELSGASRLLAATRSYDDTSLHPESPSLLLDATTGELVPHFIEPDVAAAANPERQVLFLRPGVTLESGHRYVVGFQNLKHPDGSDVEAEPAFAAIRDGRPTDIPGVEARRKPVKKNVMELVRAGASHEDLVLAFDFVVQSDEQLTGEMLAMRDRSYAWLAGQGGETFEVFPFAAVGSPVQDVDLSFENDCSVPEERTWREVRGRFQTPLYLSSDPLLQPLDGSRLVDDDADGLPDPQGTMAANFSITVPCSALDPLRPPLQPILTGHGLFGNGRQIVNTPQFLGQINLENGGADFHRISGATDWLGLSSNDFQFTNLFNNFIVTAVLFDLDNFGTLPDRLRQGMSNTLVLARMMREGRFNSHAAFQRPDGQGVFPGTDQPIDYFGISLGGVMGTFASATSPDLERIALDIPAANFSIMIQRSTAIGLIDLALSFINPDPMAQAIFFGLAEELWDSAEPVGYLRRITRDPLPGSGPPKDLLYSIARFDGVVANEASEIAVRTLGLPNLHDASLPAGSAVSELLGIPDVAGPLSEGPDDFVGAFLYYDLGSFDLSDPAEAALVPPLSNSIRTGLCEPHGASFQAPASARQVTTWLETGTIANFCDGLCDGKASGGGDQPFEFPGEVPCEP